MIDRIMVLNVISVLGLITLTIAVLDLGLGAQQPIEPKFKVVDTYHGCAIVRYTDQTNRWHYFMDCKSSTGVK